MATTNAPARARLGDVDVIEPIGDGGWWLTFCHLCGIVCGPAQPSEAAAYRQAAGHNRARLHDHAKARRARPC